MLLLLMALTSISAWAETVNGVKYIKYDSENKVYAEATQNDVTVLTGSETTLTAGWYVVNGNVNYNSYLYTEANEGEDVNIILSDGATLTVVALTSNFEGRERLSIYGQSQGTGTANISRSLMGCYSLTIYGGIINANILDCAQGGVGIYGGTVNAGIIKPYGGVYLTGGNVTVTGEIEARDQGFNIDLCGATVKASSYNAARVCIQKGLTYYDGTGASYSGTIEYYQNLLDLKPDEITAIAGKTLRTYDYRDGTCGDPTVNEGKNVTWLYNIATRTLTISGTGAMADYESADNQPWKEYRSSITSVVIENDVTSIGANAFSNYSGDHVYVVVPEEKRLSVTIDGESDPVVIEPTEGKADILDCLFADPTDKSESRALTLKEEIVTEITVEKSTLQLTVNDEIATGASLTPAEAGNLVYSSSDEEVAKVVDGKIKALAAGTATITVSFAGNDKYAAAESKIIKVNVSLKWYVNVNAHVSGDGKTKETPFQTLKEALDEACYSDIIMIAAGTYTGENNVGLQIEKNDLTLKKYGDGEAIFDAESGENIFYSENNDAKSINIEGLTFKNAKSAIVFKNGMCDSNIDATFINIGTGQWGSAIYATSAENVDITGTFINNKAGEGLINISTANNVVIHDAVFLNNGESPIFTITNGQYQIKDNWFGNTKDDYTVAPANAGVVLDNWLFLDAAVSEATLKVMESADVKYIFSSYDGTTVSECDYSKLPAVNLSLTATNGDVDNTVAVGETVKYVATEHGQGSVTATIESVSYKICFTNNLNDIKQSVSAQDITCIEDETLTITLENIPDNQPANTATGKFEITLTSDVFSGSKEIDAGGTTGIIETSLEGHKVTIQGKSSDNDVKTTFTIADLPAGSYGVTVKYSGDNVFNEATSNASFTVTKAPTEITVEKATLELKVGDEIATGASLTPAEAGSLVYTSSNEQVAVVKDGKIKALAAGTATITVSYAGTDKYAAAQSQTIAVTVTLNESSVSVNNLPPDGSCLYVDDTFTLITTTTPEGLNVTYIPDDSGVLSLDENGVVTALKEGTASVTVKVGGDGVYAESSTTVTLTVTKVPTEITVEKATLELKVGDEIATGASLTPAGAGNLVYTSSNEQVAVVKDGKIKALAAGTATITVSYAGTDKYAAAQSQTIALTVTLEGDSNNDGVVNVSDVVKAVSDGKTQAEIDAIVNIIMGRK